MSSDELRHLISRKTGGLSIDPMILSVRCKKDPCGHVVVGGKVMAARAEDLFELVLFCFSFQSQQMTIFSLLCFFLINGGGKFELG